MVKNRDVMRSDRLKQVMQQIDPNFDERNAGFNRFSKFVSEAGHKGLIKVAKLENGQYEVAPADGAGAGRPALAPAAASGREGERAGARRSRGGRGRGRGDRGPSAAAGEAPAREEAAVAAAPSAPRGPGGLTLAESFELVRGALAELETPVAAEALRLRMSALHGRQDPLLEADRFTRLLRQVHDAEVADVRKLPDGRLEVERRPGSTGSHARISRPAEHAPLSSAPREAEEPIQADRPQETVVEITSTEGTGRAGLRFRRGTKTPSAPPVIPLVGIVSMDEEAPAPPHKAVRKGRGAPRGGEAAVGKKPSRPRSRKKPAQATDPDE